MPSAQTHTRLYVCPACTNVAEGPLAGGPVTCPRCSAETTLPDRSALLTPPTTLPLPTHTPHALASLRAQDGKPRRPSPTLVAILGGPEVQLGREAEVLLIWQNLRRRTAANDMAASEDLSLLTLMLAQREDSLAQHGLGEALTESALDVVLLPRQRQELLGRLCRFAVSRGDRARARGLVGLMSPTPTDLDSDSEYRICFAFIAALELDGARLLEALGPTKDIFPIHDSIDDLASVLRAHGHELRGDVATAKETLAELGTPAMLILVQKRYPLLLLCPRSSETYVAAYSEQAARKAASDAGAVSQLFGCGLFATGLLMTVIMSLEISNDPDSLPALVIGAVITAIGTVLLLRGRAAARRASWLRLHGLSLNARVLGAKRTGTEINNVPLMAFDLRVDGPSGPYPATVRRVVPEHQVALLIGREIKVRAHPDRLEEVIFEE